MGCINGRPVDSPLSAEQERGRKEQAEVITGVVSLVFLAFVAYLLLAALGWL